MARDNKRKSCHWQGHLSPIPRTARPTVSPTVIVSGPTNCKHSRDREPPRVLSPLSNQHRVCRFGPSGTKMAIRHKKQHVLSPRRPILELVYDSPCVVN